MILELIERKGKPTKTKVQFAKKSWEKLPEEFKKKIQDEAEEIHETKRNIYFIYDGDLINLRYGGKDGRYNEK